MSLVVKDPGGARILRPAVWSGAAGGRRDAVRGWLLVQLGLSAAAWAIIAGLLSLAA
jgi:hypothetical protein